MNVLQGCRKRVGAFQFFTKQLTLSQPGGGADYAHHSKYEPPPPGFSDLVTALIRMFGTFFVNTGLGSDFGSHSCGKG